mmetsp:Transcript_23863/g.52263  ORF Transcript_23863/g.52263 Transcript_23863/m.52263 type:complete len:454 (+) Transcript_23863:54-1415(+)|eukprot:CAMPEP_0202892252 /NCGR_PEP_ID=MMETSP1392-20130828/2011_1 /ASSEMBLY_ACC=CAM_ASM_000868 /TAXON_ID=225041 /ORGANISM="Chlamydomonas chlamydogama, Strain SAG 11-48b" /LENGTH=453 /DNA_ID=CAMNT_0049576145 /DNA_START=54 /DNA_END=1415 /DNA_ORIENTATION=+
MGLICVECSATFASRKELQQHQRHAHNFCTAEDSDSEPEQSHPADGSGNAVPSGTAQEAGGKGVMGARKQSSRHGRSARGRKPKGKPEDIAEQAPNHSVEPTTGSTQEQLPQRNKPARGRRGAAAAAGAHVGSASSPADPAVTAPKLLRRPQGARTTDNRAVPGPTVGAVADVSHQNAAAEAEEKAAAAAMAALTGLSLGSKGEKDQHGDMQPATSPGQPGDSAQPAAPGRASSGRKKRGPRSARRAARKDLPAADTAAPHADAEPDAVAVAVPAPATSDSSKPASSASTARSSRRAAATGSSKAAAPKGGRMLISTSAKIQFVTCPLCNSHFYSPIVLRHHVSTAHPGAQCDIVSVPRETIDQDLAASGRRSGQGRRGAGSVSGGDVETASGESGAAPADGVATVPAEPAKQQGSQGKQGGRRYSGARSRTDKAQAAGPDTAEQVSAPATEG